MDYTQERLSKIEVTQERILTLLESLSEELRSRAEEGEAVERLLYGHNGAPGLVIRLDRLEQAQERGRWVTRAVVGAVVTLLVGGVWSALAG